MTDPAEANAATVVAAPEVTPTASVSTATPANESKAPLSTLDNPEAVSKVQEQLDAFNAGEEVTPAKAENTETPEEVADEGEQKPEVVPTEKKPEPAAKASTVPAAYRRSLKSREWTDEEIDGFYTQNPEAALRTFEKIHESRKQELAQWAAIGRQHQAAAKPAGEAGAPAPKNDPIAALKPIDVKALAEKLGSDEESVRELVAPINAVVESLKPLVQQAQAAAQIAAQQERDSLGKQVDSFFVGDEVKEYSEIYGGDRTSLSQDQINARLRVCQIADSLVAGAKVQGHEITIDEALALAHESVSGIHKEKVIRERIKKDLKQREKSISLKPTHRGDSPNQGAPKNRDEMVSRTSSRLQEVFG